MPKSANNNEHYEVGLDNIFADLELKQSDELMTRASLQQYLSPKAISGWRV